MAGPSRRTGTARAPTTAAKPCTSGRSRVSVPPAAATWARAADSCPGRARTITGRSPVSAAPGPAAAPGPVAPGSVTPGPVAAAAGCVSPLRLRTSPRAQAPKVRGTRERTLQDGVVMSAPTIGEAIGEGPDERPPNHRTLRNDDSTYTESAWQKW